MKKLLGSLSCALLLSVLSNAQTITTVAGIGSVGYSGDGGPAKLAELGSLVYHMAVDSSGNVYIADRLNSVIRKVDAATNIISTIAGNNTIGFSGDGGPATNAQLYYPLAIALDRSEKNLYIADSRNYVIRKLDLSTGTINTIAGTAMTTGSGGDGGPAIAASFKGPTGLCFDASDNIYISDGTGSLIRKIDAAGIIKTIAGKDGFMACSYGDDGPASLAYVGTPVEICIDAKQNLYFAEQYVSGARKIDAGTTIIHTLAGNGTPSFSGDGGPSTAALLQHPSGVAVDPDGNVYIADTENGRIRKIDIKTGIISTFAGKPGGLTADGVPATNASMHPFGLCFDKKGNLYVADDTRVRKIDNVFIPADPSISLAVKASPKQTASVFPNPSNGQFTIQQDGVVNCDITVLNVLGEKVFEKRSSGSLQLLDISDQPNGVYFLTMISDGIISSQKITINK